MNPTRTPSYRDHAHALRRDELARIAVAIAIKWQTFWKATHAAHPSKVPAPSHP